MAELRRTKLCGENNLTQPAQRDREIDGQTLSFQKETHVKIRVAANEIHFKDREAYVDKKRDENETN